MSDTNLVVVYGSLLSGLGNHHVMQMANGELVGTGKSVDNFDMFSLGGFPSVSLEHNEHGTPLTVEVYKVKKSDMTCIDRLEGYRPDEPNGFYNRSPIKVKLDDTGEVIEGLIYHIDEKKQTPVVSGDWRAYREEQQRAY